MPLLQSLTTYFALNASNDTSPSGLTDSVTEQPIYIPDLDVGVYFDLTEAEANALSNTSVATLHAGRYRRVQVDSGATAANVKTGTIGLLSPSYAPTFNLVTSYDLGVVGCHPVVFLNAITPGNYGFVQELGIATVLGKSSSFTQASAVGAIAVSYTGGLVDTATAWATTFLGYLVQTGVAGGLFKILLEGPYQG